MILQELFSFICWLSYRDSQGDISLDELRSAMLSDLSEKELNSAVEVYRHAYGDTISEAEAFEEMCCDALGKINIFAGTEHDSANYGKVQESFRKHTAETASKGRAPPKGKTKGYSLEPVEAIQPTSVEWERGSTTEEVRGVQPQMGCRGLYARQQLQARQHGAL